MKNVREIDFFKSTMNGELIVGALYYSVYNVWPNCYDDNSKIDTGKVRKFLQEKYELDSSSLVISNASQKKGGTKESLIVAQIPQNVLFVYKHSMDSEPYFCLMHCDPKGEKEVAALITEIRGLEEVKKSRNIYMLSKEYDCFHFRPFELAEKMLPCKLKEHYNDDFSPIDLRIKEALKDKEEGLILLHGKPGTGKTSYLKNLIDNTERKVVYMPSELVSEMGSPGFLDALFKMKGSVLIIEDAEQAMFERGGSGSDSAAVSTLLNVTDGFLAGVLQLTVICTFNTKWSNIDKALTRKGRIITKYQFDDLAPEKVSGIVGAKMIETDKGKAMTLAEAFNYEAPELTVETNKIGFLSALSN
jgi:hypothetical protein